VFKLLELKKLLEEFLYSKARQLASSLQEKSADISEHAHILKEFETILVQTHRKSMVSFVYKSTNDLIRTQNIMLDLAQFFISFVDVITYDLRPVYFSCLIAILKRGELDLGFLTINNADSKTLAKKREVAMRYRDFLMACLKLVLKKLNFKGGSEGLKKFIEVFLALAYFRIPLFR
jgi:hypothetical protein